MMIIDRKRGLIAWSVGAAGNEMENNFDVHNTICMYMGFIQMKKVKCSVEILYVSVRSTNGFGCASVVTLSLSLLLLCFCWGLILQVDRSEVI